MSWLLVAGLGAAAQALQILLIRELLAFSLGNELSVAVLLAVWMTGTAVGSGLAATLMPVLRTPARQCRVYTGGALLLTLGAPCSLWCSRLLHSLSADAVGTAGSVSGILLAALVLGGALAVVPGFLFPVAIRMLAGRDGVGPGHAYAWEAVGAAVAGIALSTVLGFRVNPFTLALIVLSLHAAGAALYFGVAPLFRDPDRRATACRARAVLTATTFLTLGVAFILGPWLDRCGQARFWHAFSGGRFRLIETSPSPYGRLAVLGYRGQMNLYGSGQLLFSLPDRGEAAAYVQLAMLQVPDPKRVLLIGGTYAGVLKEVLRHPIQGVDCVEADEALGMLAEKYLAPADRRALADPRVRLRVTDGRRFLRSARDLYDVILVQTPEPDTIAANRFYTLEFFAAVQAALRPRGVFGLGPVAAHGAYADARALERNAILMRTLEQVFPTAAATAGSAPLFLAAGSPDTICLDLSVLLTRLERRGLPLVDFSWLVDSFGLERAEAELHTGVPYDPLAPPAAAVAQRTQFRADTAVNTDSRPLLCLRSILMWNAFREDWAGLALERLSAVAWWLWLLPFACIVLAAVLGRSGRVGAVLVPCSVTLVLGFWGAAMQWLVLASFQVAFGALYRWVGLLIGSFMIGLALGAGRLARRGGAGRLLPVLPALAVCGGLAGMLLFRVSHWAGAWSWQLGSGLVIVLAHVALALGSGALVGAAFPVAVQALDVAAAKRRPNATAARAEARHGGICYALDVVGGVAGMVLGACVLLPAHGAPGLMAVAGGSCLLAAAAAWLAQRG